MAGGTCCCSLRDALRPGGPGSSLLRPLAAHANGVVDDRDWQRDNARDSARCGCMAISGYAMGRGHRSDRGGRDEVVRRALIIWLIATRRYRAALLTAVCTPLVVLAAWAVIGFSAIGRYPSILSANTKVFSSSGPYLQGLLLQLHGSSTIALGAGIIAAAALLVVAWFSDDLGCFTLAISAAIVLSPVAWIGYAGLLVIPLAVIWPRWSSAWLLLLGTYIHWYNSPLHYRSPALSLSTLALLAIIVMVILHRTATVDESRVEPRHLASI